MNISPTMGLIRVAIMEICHFRHRFANKGARHSLKVATYTFPGSRDMIVAWFFLSHALLTYFLLVLTYFDPIYFHCIVIWQSQAYKGDTV